ncbi:growth hormone-inducible transmembrane protein-like [Orussus abietinus]|uniref:growth hormone-inducible transmembrane protein-like n=1 Tax=Orussus abietinus TaxID=222816 RepID=UPI0006261BD5|nr:growth hormone-inducible transmembrane protein-like [Orussus abietinus]XP_012275193.1 growth hormone-inducible transmembrane protein-like [Orussus abietinus]XP_023289175.1 growth hormone-inducible transmembrane protein-like [Orussus abietinus]
MLLARVCRASLAPQVAGYLKAPVSKPFVPKFQTVRLLASDGRSTFTRTARKRTSIVEGAMAPAGETAFNIGKGVIAGGAALGLGALCYYGLGLSSQTGTIDHVALWPQYVKDRIHSTYLYFGGSILVSGLSAAACLRSTSMMNLMMRQGWGALAVSMIAMIGTGMLAQSIPYKEGFGPKQMAWLVHTGVIGAVLAPMCLLGGPLVMRAALYTAGVVGGLTTVALCAPNDKFLNMGGPLAIGLGVVFVSSLGSFFLPPTTVLGSGLYSIALYGGLVLFSMFLLHDTQRIIKNAETHPVPHPYFKDEARAYDPINNAISIYLDTVNIFVRILSILAGGGNRRK